MKSKYNKLVIASLFAAITCVATMVIHIPSPMDGYLNLGDCIVLLCGLVLGPFYGGLAAAIGSSLADAIYGYFYYVPATFIIKGLVAICAYYLMKLFLPKLPRLVAQILSFALSEVIMVLGYFGFAALVLGNGISAAASIPGNCLQGLVGIIAAIFINDIFNRNKKFKELLKEVEK